MSDLSFRAVTAESSQHLAMRTQAATPDLLNCSDPAQQELEASVFLALSAGGDRAAHPLRVHRVRLEAGQPPIIFLDSHTGSGLVSRAFIENGLPVHAADGVVSSPGVRVIGVSGLDLHLGLASTAAHVVLRGATGTHWNGDLEARRRQLTAYEAPLWSAPALVTEEFEVSPAAGGGFGLGSRLLRRIAVFTEKSNAHLTYTYTDFGRSIKVWMEIAPPIPVDHRQLTEALLDQRWGLGMRVRGLWCRCGTGSEASCTVQLVEPSQGSAPERLTLLFARLAPTGDRGRDYFRIIGADPAWIRRTLPNSASLNPTSSPG